MEEDGIGFVVYQRGVCLLNISQLDWSKRLIYRWIRIIYSEYIHMEFCVFLMLSIFGRKEQIFPNYFQALHHIWLRLICNLKFHYNGKCCWQLVLVQHRKKVWNLFSGMSFIFYLNSQSSILVYWFKVRKKEPEML